MKQKESRTIKRVKKNAKRIRSVTMLALMSIMLLSTATYAWFTLSDTARISGLSMSVTDATGLRVHPYSDTAPTDASDKWASKIDFAENGATPWKGSLLPATTSDGKSFYEPEYDEDGMVGAVKELVNNEGKLTKETTDDKTEGYYYETSFWMESMGEDGDIVLVQGSGSGNDRKGTYVIENTEGKDTSKTTQNAIAALRISITAGNGAAGETGIYEPCSDKHNTGLKSEVKDAAKISTYTTLKQTEAGKFSPADSEGNSNKLFTLKANEKTKITLRVWIEGNDEDCVNQIQLAKLIAQLQFKKITK